MSRTAIVLQARMGSRRLPGKSLARIGGCTLLGHCIERLRTESGLAVIVATTDHVVDDAIVDEAEAYNTPVIRGSQADVLSRYVLAASTYGLTHVVRATADNPAVDMAAPLRTLALLEQYGADHATETDLPLGACVEAMTAAALVRAGELASASDDREHVTPYLRRARDMYAITAPAPVAVRRPALRLTVDTADDLTTMRRIYARLGSRGTPAPLEEIIAVADRLGIVQPVAVEVVA